MEDEKKCRVGGMYEAIYLRGKALDYYSFLRLLWGGRALTAPYIGRGRLRLGLPLGRLGRTLDRLLDAPWLAPWIALRGRAWGESSLGPFLGTSSFCLTGKKIPNVVGFGTFPNVVGSPSLQTVPRIEAALQGAFNCAFYGAWLRLA